jgi:hypothetical protein
MSHTKTAQPRMAAVIRSEISSAPPPQSTQRPHGLKHLESIRLREYQDGNMTSVEMVTMFLQDVDRATRADISGATGLAWATVHNALMELDSQHHLRRHLHTDPEEYSWKR